MTGINLNHRDKTIFYKDPMDDIQPFVYRIYVFYHHMDMGHIRLRLRLRLRLRQVYSTKISVLNWCRRGLVVPSRYPNQRKPSSPTYKTSQWELNLRTLSHNSISRTFTASSQYALSPYSNAVYWSYFYSNPLHAASISTDICIHTLMPDIFDPADFCTHNLFKVECHYNNRYCISMIVACEAIFISDT